MVKLIMGLKGSGKTKKLVDLVCEAIKEENGDVVVIEKNDTLTYDIPYQARLVDANEYPIGSYDFMKGWICGLHAGNYDITYIFVDNFLKMVDDKSPEALEQFVTWLEDFSEKQNIKFVLSVSLAVEECPESIKKFL